jgi:UTRA domain
VRGLATKRSTCKDRFGQVAQRCSTAARSGSGFPCPANVPRWIATQVIGAKAATAPEARILQETRGAPLLTMTRTAWDAAGRAFEYGSHIYPASRYSFELTLAGG